MSENLVVLNEEGLAVKQGVDFYPNGKLIGKIKRIHLETN